MNTKKRIAKFLTTLTCLGMASVNGYVGSGDSSCGPSYDPCCPSPDRCFFADIDYIYWTARQDGMDFAYSGVNIFQAGRGSSINVDCGSGEWHNCNYNWNSGFKIGAGLANPCCDWEIYAQYTWYRAEPSFHRNAPTESNLINAWETLFFPRGEQDFDIAAPIIDGALTAFPLRQASAKWKFQYNNIDVLVTNEFCVNNCFTLRPSFGIKGAWFHQTYHINYDVNEDLLGVIGEFAARVLIKSKQDFWGVGPKFALTAAASLFDCISIYGNLGVSALWSEYSSPRRDKQELTPATEGAVTTVTQTLCTKRNFCIAEPVIETSIGARWDTDFCCGDYGFYVKIAWENQIWFNHNHHIRLEGLAGAHGDLTLQGLTLGAGLSF